ncbi:MAG: molybdenum cofactor guanylyltransferase [Acidobacteria bacterium]|nr:molybdenum cofactor guanylyltransferase [Acidobacteriota bacterium]
MGRDKALLELAGRPLALRTADILRPLVDQVVLVGAPERCAHLGLPVLADRVAGKGPLAGMVTALAATAHEWNLVLACDLPYMETRALEVLLHLVASTPNVDAIVPRMEEGWPRLRRGWQPLCAAYHRRCLPAFERVLDSDHPKIARAFGDLRVRAVTAAELERFALSARMFKNMNTPEDYEEARRTLEA